MYPSMPWINPSLGFRWPRINPDVVVIGTTIPLRAAGENALGGVALTLPASPSETNDDAKDVVGLCGLV